MTSNNTRIANNFINATYFGIVELGGAASSVVNRTQTVSEDVELTVDLTQLSTKENLLFGFYNGTSLGAGPSSLSLSVSATGLPVLTKTFGGGTSPGTYFSDDPILLGALANSGSTITLDLQFTETFASAGAGYDFGILIGQTSASSVTYSNDAPSGTNKTVSTVKNGHYTFNVADFGFSDPNDSPANALTAVMIATLPSAGALTDNGTAVTAGQFVSAADITNGQLVFTPTSGTTGSPETSFTFQVQDNGGTANGGVDTDATPNTLAINIWTAMVSHDYNADGISDILFRNPTSGDLGTEQITSAGQGTYVSLGGSNVSYKAY